MVCYSVKNEFINKVLIDLSKSNESRIIIGITIFDEKKKESRRLTFCFIYSF